MSRPPVTEQHRWLHRLLGEWTWYHEAIPGQPDGNWVQFMQARYSRK